MLGTGVTGLGTLRCLGRAGITVLCTASPGDLGASCRWYRPAPAMRSGESLQAYLTRIPTERAVLIPCSDHLTREAASISDDLRGRFPASVASIPALDTLVDKAAFAEMLQSSGLPHPLTVVVSTLDDLARVPDQVWTSAFLKPRDSQAFFARHRVKALRVRSQREAARQWEELHADGFSMIVQEYVPGPASAHYFVDGFVDCPGSIRATFVRRRLRMDPPDFGNSSFMVSVVPEEGAGAIDTIRRVVTLLRYRGAFSAEFKLDERDGLFKILEVNARPWWYVEFAQRCGVNVPLMMYRDALGERVPATREYRVGRTLVYPNHDFGPCFMEWRARRLSLWQWGRQWVTSVQPVFSWEDPMPGVRSAGHWMKRHVWPAAKG